MMDGDKFGGKLQFMKQLSLVRRHVQSILSFAQGQSSRFLDEFWKESVCSESATTLVLSVGHSEPLNLIRAPATQESLPT